MHLLNIDILCKQPATTLHGRRYCVSDLQNNVYGLKRISMKCIIDVFIGWPVDEQETISRT
ncbi:MAG TPA: hypothetical protein ENJ08_08340 [Gammaproteobacteria bacterium]|nr:hypothetical protein [Gammaproteobacteria bacterium]